MSLSSSNSDHSDNESLLSNHSIETPQDSGDISELIDSIQSINLNSDMAPPEFKIDYLKIVPEFKGNQTLLGEFITTSEQLIHKFYNNTDESDFQNTFLLKGIKNKIKGEAAEAIASYNISTWLDLKNALLATYADKRDLQTLTMELCVMKQAHLKPLEFFAKIQTNLNLQVNLININSQNAIEKDTLTKNSNKLALRVFLKNLNGQLGELLATRNPDSLNSALHILTNDFNITNKTFNLPNSKYNLLKQIPISSRNVQSAQNPAIMYKPQFHSQNQSNRSNVQRNNSQSFNSRNVFKPNPNYRPTYTPTPMSIATSVNRPQRNSKPGSSSNVVVEELFNTEDKNLFQESDNEGNDPEYSIYEDLETGNDHFLGISASE